MKKLIASILTVLTIGASAQLTYVTTLDGVVDAPMVVEYYGNNFIDDGKYLIVSSGQYSYDILNPDFSLHKKVTIDTTGWKEFGYLLNMVEFSDHLYNMDDKVEIIYSIYQMDSDGYVPIGYAKTVVINEDGVQLQIIETEALAFSNSFQSDGKTYLKTLKENWSAGETVIYEAAGTLPCKTCSSTEATPTQKAPEKAYDINVFPNPTTNQITLAINTDKTGMKVHIYSMDGKLVKSASVVNGNNLIDTADLVAGTYIYNVQTDTEVIHASQFIKK